MGLSRRTLLLSAAATAWSALDGPLARAALPDEIVCPLATTPTVLIPGISGEWGARLLGGKIYRGLMRWAADGTLQPDLARTVSLSPDGLTYRIDLQPGITWHDSGGFTAADVAFSLGRFHRALQPRLRLERVTIATPDPLTVVLTLPAPDAAFLHHLDALSLPIVPQHVHDRPGWALDPREVAPIGTGPFRVSDWLRLVRFEWFTGPVPPLATIYCPILPDPASRIALAETNPAVLLAGDAIETAALPRLRGLATLAVSGELSPAAPSIAGLRLNLAATPLDQVAVRLGLACAIDRQAMLREAWAGLGRVATGPTVAGSANRNGAADLPDYSPRVAAEHFNAAGLRPDEDGIRAKLRFLVPPGAPWQALFAALRTSLGQVAIELSADTVPAADWARRVAAGEYQMTGFISAQTGDPALDLAGYGLPELGPLLAGGDAGEQQAQAVLVEQMPALWLIEPAILVVLDKRLRLEGGILGNFAQTSLSG